MVDMCSTQTSIYNIPNLVSFIRILMVPVLLALALNQQPVWYIAALIFTGFTDVLDGYLARRLNQITELGSHLDSWGDFTVYSTMAVCAWLLWPDIVKQQSSYFIIIVISFTLPVIVGLVRFMALTSYHTWSVKVAVAMTFIGYVSLFSDLSVWPFRLAAVMCAYAAMEEILITLLMHHQRVDVRSVWQALKYNKADS